MKSLLALVLCLCSFAACALDVPTGAMADARVKTVVYNENDVVAIYAYPGVATHVMFAPGEEVLDMASGFSAGWEFSNRRNNLYLKPKSLDAAETGGAVGISPKPGRWDTNLIVTTNLRVYSFQLFLIGPRVPDAKLPQDSRMAFRVKFVYPLDDAAKAAAQANARIAQTRLDLKPVIRNAKYTMQVGRRSAAIAPTAAYDDGRFTYLKFPNNREIPAVFLVAQDGTESLVNVHVDNDLVVVQRVAPRLSLRLGKQIVAVFNEAYDIDGVPTSDGTTVNGVRRVIIQGSQQ
jgi:P-type conjugative transfer protein VirB9